MSRGQKAQIWYIRMYLKDPFVTSYILLKFSTPPRALLLYCSENQFVDSKSLPQKFYRWLKCYLDDAGMTNISEHKSVNGVTHLLCHYEDGDRVWLSIEEVKADSKIFLGEYMRRKKNLSGSSGQRIRRVIGMKKFAMYFAV